MLLRTLSFSWACTQNWLAGSQGVFMVSLVNVVSLCSYQQCKRVSVVQLLTLLSILVILAYLVDSSQILIFLKCEVEK